MLIAGGFDGETVLSTIELVERDSGVATVAAFSLTVGRAGLSATTLVDGRVLLAGGNDGNNDLALAEVVTVSTGVVSAGAAGESIGAYQIRQGTVSAGSNYQLTFVPGTFKIEYAPANVSCLGGPGRTILQPINVNGQSVFKQGSTVPAKFRVCDANGNSVGAPGVVTSFKLLQITSGTVTLVNEDVLSTAADTAFRWSADGAQWIFNISTKNLKANQTYVYQVSLNDGSAFTFSFGLK